jgi:hypothetical protein
VDAKGIDTASREPVLGELFPPHPASRVRKIGELRLPIAGPYRPRARLYQYPDGRLVWLVRLWDRDRAVSRLVSTATLREFARLNRLARVRAEVDALVERAEVSDRP